MARTPQSIVDVLGRSCELPIDRLQSVSAYLKVWERDQGLLLLGNEVPRASKPGDVLNVFVYLDSQDRPVATLRTPQLELGEVAFLEVTALTEFGAFVDWGLPKELL